LCRWGDPGFGALVRRGKQHEHHFDEQLVEATARLVSNRWRPSPGPTWITCVPSRRHQTLVPDFARSLARRLSLPFVECIRKVRDTEPQKTRANSFQQAQNLVGAFAVDHATVRPGPHSLMIVIRVGGRGRPSAGGREKRQLVRIWGGGSDQECRPRWSFCRDTRGGGWFPDLRWRRRCAAANLNAAASAKPILLPARGAAVVASSRNRWPFALPARS
jgi:hypothetical protein